MMLEDIILFALSDVVWQAIISAVVTIAIAIIAQRAKTAVVTTLETVTASRDVKLDKIQEIAQTSHDLANSAMLAQKLLVATSSRGKADATHDPADEALATQAELVYRQHKEDDDRAKAEKKAKSLEAIIRTA